MRDESLLSPIMDSKRSTSRQIAMAAADALRKSGKDRPKLIWLEAAGCSGNIISMLDGRDPDLLYLMENVVELTYNNSLMAAEGERAYEAFLDTMNTDFILAVEGAVATADNGIYNIIARHRGRAITGAEAVRLAAEKAGYVIAIGTCASYGGISSAAPNPAGCTSVARFLQREVIRVPGCPGHPDWAAGTIAHAAAFGTPELDRERRPVMFYGITIHDRCTRRSYFDNGIFASRLGEGTCMFKLGCRGPVTRTDCPIRRWNDTQNWPVGDNTPCIGCARQGFPDETEPFITF